MKTNLLSTLFIIYLICFQNALNATHLNKIKIDSISNVTKSKTRTETTNSNKSSINKNEKTKNTAAEEETSDSTSLTSNSGFPIKSKAESESLIQTHIQTTKVKEKTDLKKLANLAKKTLNIKIHTSNLLKKTIFKNISSLSSSSSSEAKAGKDEISPSSTEAEVAEQETTLRDKMKAAAYKFKVAGACVKGIISAFPSSFCAKNGGDAGTIPTECVDGWVRQGAMCYKKCDPDMDLVAGVCWKKCKSGYKNLGLACFKKPFKFYFKSSYVTKAATNFDTQSTCKAGNYKFGALCYRDCQNINMVNCGIGYCAMDKNQCNLGITTMSVDITYGIIKIILFFMSYGASSAASTQMNAAKSAVDKLTTTAKKSLWASTQAYLKKKVDKVSAKLTTSFIKTKLQEVASKEFLLSKSESLGKSILIPTAVNSVCNQVAANYFVKQTESEQKSTSQFDFMMLDIFGFANVAMKCDVIASETDKVLCADALISIFKPFDPTGVFTLAGAFLTPVCNLPNYIVSYEPEDGCVRFYEKTDYEGDYIDVCADTQYFLKTFGNKASSMKLSETIEIKIWAGENFTGEQYFFDSFTYIYDLSLADLNDTIGSFNIRHLGARENCVVVYDQCDYKGNSFQYCESQSDVVKNLSNLTIKSAITGSGGNGVYFYTEANYIGTNFYKLMDSSKISCFDSTTIKTSQIKSFSLIPVAKEGCVKLFKSCNYTGDSLEICTNIPDNRYSTYQSIAVGSNTQITVQSSTNYAGVFYNLIDSLNISCLKDFITMNSLKMQNQVSFQSFLISKKLPSAGCIVVYEEVEFKGRAREICESDISFEFNEVYKKAGVSESFSSLIIGENVEVLTLFSNENFKGTSVDLLNNIDLDSGSSAMQHQNLSLFSIDLLFKSIKLIPKISKNCTLIYESAYFTGKRTELCAEKATYAAASALKIASLVVKELVQFSLYTTSDYKTLFKFYNGYLEVSGESGEFTGKTFLSYELDTIAPKDNCMNLFPEVNFQGKLQKICASITDFSSYAAKALSLKTGQGFREALFFSGLSYTSSRYSVDDSLEIVDLTKWNYANTDLNVSYTVAFSSMKSVFLVPSAPNAGCVRFFTKALFQGTSLTICDPDNKTFFSVEEKKTFNNNTGSILVGDNTQFFASTTSNNNYMYYITEKNLLSLTSVETVNPESYAVTLVNLENKLDSFDILDLQNVPAKEVLFFKENFYLGRAQRVTQAQYNSLVFGACKSFKAGSSIRKITISNNSFSTNTNWLAGVHISEVYSVEDIIGNGYKSFDSLKVIPYVDEGCLYVYDYLENHTVCSGIYAKLDNAFYQGKTFNMLFRHQETYIATAENTIELIFKEENYTGDVKKIVSLDLNIAGFFNSSKSSTSSVFKSVIVTQVNSDCIRIFTTKNLDGVKDKSQQYCYSTASLNGAFDKAASLVIGDRISKIILYSGENYSGTTKELTASSYILDLSLEKFTIIKSVLIVPKVSNDCLLVNDQCNFQGKSIEVCGSIDKMVEARDELKNFSIKSVMVGSTYQARLYQTENYEGKYISFSSEIGKTYSSCITDASNENFSYPISSILLTGKTPKFNCLMAFEKCEFLGERFEICFDVGSGLAAKIPQILSFKTGSSTDITVFDKDNYSKLKYNSVTFAKNDSTNQNCLTANSTVVNAKSIKLTISANEIKLSDENCLKVFSQCNYNGSSFEICADIASKSANALLANFAIASFKLGSNNQVNLFQLDNYTGSSAIYSSGISMISSPCVSSEIKFEINSMQFISSTPKSNGIMLFSDTVYKGIRYQLFESNPKNPAFKSFKIGSLVKGYFYQKENYATTSQKQRISFAANDDSTSASRTYLSVEMGRDSDALKSSATEKEESLIVEAVKDPVRVIATAQNECFIVFEECDYYGDYTEYCEADGSVKDSIQKVSSVIVGKNLLVTLYDDLNFSGNTIQLDESKSYRCLDELDFFDKTNSFAVKFKDPNKYY